MKIYTYVILNALLSLFIYSAKHSHTQIKTTFSNSHFHEKGLTLLKIGKNAEIQIDFELFGNVSKAYIDKLPTPVRHHIAIGFIPPAQLSKCLEKLYPDFQDTQQKQYSAKDQKPFSTELLIDQNTGLCQGVSIYKEGKLSYKIIYRYEGNKYKKCLIRNYSPSGDHSFTLNFQDYEL